MFHVDSVFTEWMFCHFEVHSSSAQLSCWKKIPQVPAMLIRIWTARQLVIQKINHKKIMVWRIDWKNLKIPCWGAVGPINELRRRRIDWSKNGTKYSHACVPLRKQLWYVLFLAVSSCYLFNAKTVGHHILCVHWAPSTRHLPSML
jgi:hypothetical protein